MTDTLFAPLSQRALLPLLAVFASTFALALPAAAEGQLRALLVGVSDYDQPKTFASLRGPVNDVELMRKVLTERGFPEQNIVLLADRPDANGRPTRDNILGALDSLAHAAGQDDVVVVHLSGHGSLQPNNNPDQDPEPDGKDQIFLPADTASWDDSLGTVRDAIVDDEIGAKLAAIRAKGAFTVLVADSCHAETLRRAYLVEQRDRAVDPELLGIPKARLEEASARATQSRGAGPESGLADPSPSAAGGFVAFYAAQRTETAPEMPLPPGSPYADKYWYGLFSYNLAQVLEASPGATYRQAFEQVLQNYRASNWFSPTPIVEGTDADLDRPLFGGAAGAAARQWPIETDESIARIGAGRLHQVSPGTVLAILPSATAGMEDVLGYARVSAADLLSSTIEPVAYADRAEPGHLSSDTFARVVDARFDARLTVARPERPAVRARETPAWDELDRLARDGLDQVTVEWLPADAPAPDLRLQVKDGRVWFLPPSADITTSEGPGQTPSLTIPDSTSGEDGMARFRADLAANLRKVAKAQTLFAIVRELNGNEVARGIEISLEVRRAATRKQETYQISDVPDVGNGDLLTINVTNKGKLPVDLTMLFVSSRYSVEPWFPYMGESNRIPPGGSVSSELEVRATTVGPEHLLLIAAVAVPEAPRADFSFLAQEGLTTKGGPIGAFQESPTISALLQAGGWKGELKGAKHTPMDLAGAASFGWNVVSDTL